MRKERLEALRFQGYAPRTLLDIGAHLGHFTAGILQVFPDCVPTLVEPNPHCHGALAALGHECWGVAASGEDGVAELFLTSEWLQSTGTSLYRENTHFFRDEVLVRTPVPKRRLDDIFAGRRFDLVKIDTQGAELDVLLGGQEVLRQSDYILIEVSMVEYNQGGARAEEVFAALRELGFRSAEVTEFHRLRGVQNGGLLQLDFLFEREVARPSQALREDAPGLAAWLASRRARCQEYSVLQLGDGDCPRDASFGTEHVAALHFTGAPGKPRDWDGIMRHVARKGRFGFALCDVGGQNLSQMRVILDTLPRIAEAGVVMRPQNATWNWQQRDGLIHLHARSASAALPILQWRGAIAMELPPATRRKAA